MSIIYIASVGQTAATQSHYWDDAKEYFKYTESILLCGKNLVDQVGRFLDPNTNLVILESPFYGMEGYSKAVGAIVMQAVDLIVFYRKHGCELDEIVVNTAGGTEKMSCIIKDAVDILKQIVPYVTHVWGARHGYKTIYTVKSNINAEDIISKANHFLNKAEQTEPNELDYFQEKLAESPRSKPQPILRNHVETEETIEQPTKQPKKKRKQYNRKPIDPKRIAQREEQQRRRQEKKKAKREKQEALRLAKHEQKMAEQVPKNFSEVCKKISSEIKKMFVNAYKELQEIFND